MNQGWRLHDRNQLLWPAAAMRSVKVVTAEGLWLLVRWLAACVMIGAFAALVTAAHRFLTALMGLSVPALLNSPHLANSLGEFWTKRWNPAASVLVFRTYCFAPLARRGPASALFVAFLISAIVHALLAFVAAMGLFLRNPQQGAQPGIEECLLPRCPATRAGHARHATPVPLAFFGRVARTEPLPPACAT